MKFEYNYLIFGELVILTFIFLSIFIFPEFDGMSAKTAIKLISLGMITAGIISVPFSVKKEQKMEWKNSKEADE